MKKNTFLDQYKDPRWQKKRLQIMERDEFSCQVCGEKEIELNVHHKVYIKNTDVWEYEDKYLITLCGVCHEIAHEEKEQINLILGEIDEMFLSEYLNLLIALKRIEPWKISNITEFIDKMIPVKSDKQFYE